MNRGLGRGLDKLLGAAPTADAAQTISVTQLQAGSGQPRRHFDRQELQSLSESIRRHGVIQPIIVRRLGDGFEIVAGERRWRAAQMAGLTTVPIIIRTLSDQEAMLFALVENIQRTDLNPAEQARALARLTQEFNMTHEQAADHAGMSRAGVSNLLRLLSLSPPVLRLLEDGKLGGGHARALLSLSATQQLAAARQIVDHQLSSRAAEQLAKKLGDGQTANTAAAVDADTRRVQSELSAILSARVDIRHRGKGGKLTIHYGSVDTLERLLKKLRL